MIGSRVARPRARSADYIATVHPQLTVEAGPPVPPRVQPSLIERMIVKLLEGRRPNTACPSEVAREIDREHWRQYMEPVRAAAARLAGRGRIDVVQRGEKVDPKSVRGPIRLRLAAAVDVYRNTDFRRHPECYRVGRGEQGVLTAEPYKSELLPLWRFKTETIAKESSSSLYAAFIGYRDAGDFVGMDMARKFVQMGYTRARRYANHQSGRKYDDNGSVAPRQPDAEKARAAAAFQRVLKKIQADARYVNARAAWPKTA
jgi:uncharacterized protein DUF4385/uncharacterized protein DUF3253